MRRRSQASLLGGAVVCLTLAIGVTFALADEPAPPGANARSWAPPRIALSQVEVPDGESERPNAEQWRDAKMIEPTRVSQAGRQCRTYMVREWVKVHCDQRMAEIQQLAGPSNSAFLWVNSGDDVLDARERSGGEVIFRVEKGSLSVFELRELLVDDYTGPFTQSLLIVEASWLSHQPFPRVLIR